MDNINNSDESLGTNEFKKDSLSYQEILSPQLMKNIMRYKNM